MSGTLENTKRKTLKQQRAENKLWANYKICAIVLSIIMFTFTVFSGFFYAFEISKDTSDIWFNCLQYFTQQSNFIVMFVIVFLSLFPNWKIFRNNHFLVYAMAYISFTFAGYNFILLPMSLASGTFIATPGFNDFNSYQCLLYNSTYLFNSVLLHMFYPIIMLFYFIMYRKYEQGSIRHIWNKNDTLEISGYGMIYPVLYWIYASIVCILLNDSVYGTATNIDITNGGTYFCVATYFASLFFDWFALNFYWWYLHKPLEKGKKHPEIKQDINRTIGLWGAILVMIPIVVLYSALAIFMYNFVWIIFLITILVIQTILCVVLGGRVLEQQDNAKRSGLASIAGVLLCIFPLNFAGMILYCMYRRRYNSESNTRVKKI